MFPDLDTDVIQAVFGANAGDVDQTVNQLLAMSDPKIQPVMHAVIFACMASACSCHWK